MDTLTILLDGRTVRSCPTTRGSIRGSTGSRRLRAILADRLEHGSSTTADHVLARILSEQQAIERAGWFN